MKFLPPLVLSSLLVASLGACEKSSDPAGQPSGTLKKAESSLFGYISADATLVFGGNYEAFLKHWDKSPIKKLSDKASQMTGGGDAMRNYMTCWTEKAGNSTLAGSVEFAGSGGEMTMVFDKVTNSMFTGCAKEAGYKSKISPDGKFAELSGIPDGLGGKTSVTYYFVAKDTIYTKMQIDPAGKTKTYDKGELESFIKSAKADSALSSSKLKRLMKSADRSKAFWFAGSAAGTPAADMMSEGHGWLDIKADGLSFGFSIDLAEPGMASKAVEAYAGAKSQLSSLPPSFKDAAMSVVNNSTLKADGNTLKGKFVIKNSVIEQLMPLMSMGL